MDIAHHSLDRYPGSCVPQCEKFWFQFAAKVKAETLDPTRRYGRRRRRRVKWRRTGQWSSLAGVGAGPVHRRATGTGEYKVGNRKELELEPNTNMGMNPGFSLERWRICRSGSIFSRQIAPTRQHYRYGFDAIEAAIENSLSKDKIGIDSKPVYTEPAENTKSQYAEMMSVCKACVPIESLP